MIEKRFNNPAKLQELRDMVVDSKATINQHSRQVLERRWNNFYELYRGTKNRGSYKGRADLDWASAYLAIEIITPRLFQTIFPRQKWFGIKGRENVDKKQASILETYMRKILDQPIHVRQKMISYLRYMCIYGTLICKTPFRHETKNILTKVRGEDGQPEVSDEEIVVWDTLDLQLVDLYNFYPADDTIQRIEDQPFVIHASSTTTSELKDKEKSEDNPFGVYQNLDKIRFEKDERGQSIVNPNRTDNLRAQERMLGLGVTSRTFKHQGYPVYLDEFQGILDGELIIVTVANSNTVIQAERLNTPDQEKTYVKANYIDVPNEFFGMPPHERSEKSIYELNDRVNQTMDATSLMLNPIWLNSDADIPEGKLSVFPGRIIKTTTDKGLSPLRPDVSILSPAYNAIQSLISMIQDTTGATRFLGGSAQTPELQRTATGVLSIIKEANARIALIIEGFEDSFMKPFLRKVYKTTQFHTTRKEIIQVINKHGTEYVEFDPQTIIGDYDFIPLGSQSLGSEEIMTQQVINLLNIMVKFPPEILQQYDITYLLTKITEQMLGFEDSEEIDRSNRRLEEDREKAISENVMMFEGMPAQAQNNENHRMHIEIHQGALLDPQFQGLPNPEKTKQLIEDHIQEHILMKEIAGVVAMNNGQTAPGAQGQAGVPAQEQPRATSQQGITQQLSQPSQGGTL